MMHMRVRYRQLGGHMHCRVFVGNSFTGTLAKAGEFTLDAGAQWNDFIAMMGQIKAPSYIQIVPDDDYRDWFIEEPAEDSSKV